MTTLARLSDLTEPIAERRSESVRAVSRAIAILQAINRLGSANLMTIARAAAIPYPTAARLVETLVEEGLIEREEGRKYYRPTALVRTLSNGFRDHDALVRSAEPAMRALTRELLWPISLVTRVGGAMVVRASTHARTSLTFNNYQPGFSLPILGCASGLVALAFAAPDERDTILDGLKMNGELDPDIAVMFHNDYLPNKIRGDGYAAVTCNPNTLNPGKTSSLSVPLLHRDTVVGALTLIYFARAMSVTEAVKRYLAPLLDGAAAIQRDWAAID